MDLDPLGVHMRPIPDQPGQPFDPTAPGYNPSEGDFEAVISVSRRQEISYRELVASVAESTGQSNATVAGILDALEETVRAAVARGSKVSIPGWISFERVETAARTGRNPQTGAEIKIPAGKRVKVTPGSKLRAAVGRDRREL